MNTFYVRIVGVVLLAVIVVAVQSRGRWAGAMSPGAIAEHVGIPTGGRVEKTDAQWKAVLDRETYAVTRRRGTERPFSGAYHNSNADGL